MAWANNSNDNSNNNIDNNNNNDNNIGSDSNKNNIDNNNNKNIKYSTTATTITTPKTDTLKGDEQLIRSRDRLADTHTHTQMFRNDTVTLNYIRGIFTNIKRQKPTKITIKQTTFRCK